jgi:alkane 1-monooxygenase
MKTVLRKIGFFTAFIIPALVVAGFYIGGVGNFLTIFFSFLFLPFIDQIIGTDTSNISENDLDIVGEDFFYRFVTYVWAYFQFGFLLWGCYAVLSGRLASVIDWIGFVVSFSLVTGGIGITVAHELGHKRSALERFYSRALLMTVCYMHFYIEHNRGHHVHVATPLDPATAKKNEDFYSFWIRSVFGGYRHSCKIEADRIHRIGKPFYHNEMVWYTILPVIFGAALTTVASVIAGRLAWEVPVFFFSQSFLAFTLLELVNYVEHYGIQRKEISPGRFERVNPRHSWNASQMLSNFFLFQLQRHSDHHAFAHKRYQILEHYDESPQLPFGYPTMIILAMMPPVWFSLMNRRLEHWQKHQALS